MELSPLTRKDLKAFSKLVRLSSRGLEFADSRVLERQTFGDPDFDGSYLIKASEKKQMMACAVGVARAMGALKTGYLKYAAVLPKFRGKGMGQALFAEMERRFQKRDAREVRVGACPPPYLQGGVEATDTVTVSFLLKRGYGRVGEIVDMTAPMRNYKPQSREGDAALERTFAIRKARAADEKALTEMVAANFPHWEQEIHAGFAQGAVFMAEDKGQPVAFCCADATNPGFLGPMGTLESARGRGLARLLLSRTLLSMKKAGRVSVRIPWVGPIPFYAAYAGAQLGPIYWQFSKKV